MCYFVADFELPACCPARIYLLKIYYGNMSDVIDTLQALFIESIYYPR